MPGGREKMLIKVKLGVPADDVGVSLEDAVDLKEIAKCFPYGRLMPIEVVRGGITYGSGRLVPELGDKDDISILVNAVVSLGFDRGDS